MYSKVANVQFCIHSNQYTDGYSVRYELNAGEFAYIYGRILLRGGTKWLYE